MQPTAAAKFRTHLLQIVRVAPDSGARMNVMVQGRDVLVLPARLRVQRHNAGVAADEGAGADGLGAAHSPANSGWNSVLRLVQKDLQLGLRAAGHPAHQRTHAVTLKAKA